LRIPCLCQMAASPRIMKAALKPQHSSFS